MIQPSIGMRAASRSVGSFGLSVTPSINMQARGVSKAAFKLSVTPRMGFAIPAPIPASLVLPVTPSIGMVGKPRARATFSLGVTPSIAMLGKGISPASFQLSVSPSLGFVGVGKNAHNVAFLDKGTGKNGTSGTALTNSHTISASANCCIAILGCSGGSSTTLTATGKVGSTAMTQLGKIGPLTAGSDHLYIFIFGLLGTPTGAQTITVTTSGSVNSYGLQSMSFSGVQGFGSAVSNSGSGTTATQAVAAVQGEAVVQAFVNGSSGTFSAYNQTQDYLVAGSSFLYPTIIGHAPGAASVSFSATETSSSFQGLAVPLL